MECKIHVEHVGANSNHFIEAKRRREDGLFRFAQPVWLMSLALFLSGGLMLAQAVGNPAPVHDVDGSFIREWLVLGPFPSRDLETDLLAEAGGETNVRPKEGDTVAMKDGTLLAWARLRSKQDLVSLDQALHVQEWAVVYAYCELNASQPMESAVRAYTPLLGVVRLNGKRIGQTSAALGSNKAVPPILPLPLNPGPNRCLLKLHFQKAPWHFLFQPLPLGRATAELKVTNPAGKPVAGALIQFYDQGELVGRVNTDHSGSAQACLFPPAAVYDLRITSGETGTWQFDVVLPPGGRRSLDVSLTSAVSISGQVLAMDRSPQIGIVVQALPVHAAEGAAIKPLLPLPAFSETVLTDANGDFHFVNLRPGHYRLRCHGPDGFIYPQAATNAPESVVTTVAPGRPPEEIKFRLPEIKKGVWKNFPITQGLQELHPMSVHRSPDGWLWIGTDRSFLYSYDGVEFKLVASAPDIPANEINTLEHAADGTLWIGTSGGISRHTGGRTQTVSFGDPLAPKNVADILADPDGSVWFATDAGLFKYDGRNFAVFTTKEGLPDNTINSLLRARDGALWMGTEQGLVRFQGGEFSLVQPFGGFSPRGTGRLHQARDGAIWFIAPDVGGACRFDGPGLSRLGVEEGLPSNTIYDMASFKKTVEPVYEKYMRQDKRVSWFVNEVPKITGQKK